MTPIDVEWFVRCHAQGLVKGPLLEVGSARIGGDPNLCDMAKKLGVTRTVGADLEEGEGVDLQLDFGRPSYGFQSGSRLTEFSTVCVFNVLEHTFDPITVLSNALSCLGAGGALLVVTPAIWPLHNYPGDYNRLLPDWYREFARLQKLKLDDDFFCWLSPFGIEPIAHLEDEFPTYRSRGIRSSPTRYWISRVGHKVLNTYGRTHWATHTAIGAAFVSSKPD
jgi:SAM-dependent methyltransferase